MSLSISLERTNALPLANSLGSERLRLKVGENPLYRFIAAELEGKQSSLPPEKISWCNPCSKNFLNYRWIPVQIQIPGESPKTILLNVASVANRMKIDSSIVRALAKRGELLVFLQIQNLRTKVGELQERVLANEEMLRKQETVRRNRLLEREREISDESREMHLKAEQILQNAKEMASTYPRPVILESEEARRAALSIFSRDQEDDVWIECFSQESLDSGLRMNLGILETMPFFAAKIRSATKSREKLDRIDLSSCPYAKKEVVQLLKQYKYGIGVIETIPLESLFALYQLSCYLSDDDLQTTLLNFFMDTLDDVNQGVLVRDPNEPTKDGITFGFWLLGELLEIDPEVPKMQLHFENFIERQNWRSSVGPAEIDRWNRALEQEQSKIAGTFLGFCYEYGIGVRADIKRAFDCQFRASNYGSNLGAAIVGEYYELGIGLDLDLEKSKTYYLQAKEKGAIRGELWSAQRESVEAIERFIQMGSIRAKILLGTYFLGHILPNGVAVPSNKKKSYELLKPLADLGIPEAIYFLAEWYYTREITDTGDDWMKIGFKLFKKSAELGCGPGAPCRVGFCYELGFGTERDLTLAYYWYQKALEGGSKKAPEDLARVQLLLNPV